MIGQILVGLDGSLAGESVLPYARCLAAGLGARLALLSVTNVSKDFMQALGLSGTSVEHLSDRTQSRARGYLQAVQHRLDRAGVSVSIEVAVGDAAAEIVRRAEQAGDDVLIALSTHGRSGISRWWYGSVAERVLLTAHLPILLVRADEKSLDDVTVSRIVLPLDGRPLSESVIPTAVLLATRFHAPVALVRAVPPPSLLDDPSLGLGSMATDQETRASLRLSAETYLNGLAENLKRRGLTTTVQAVDGDPAIEIVGAGEAQAGSLIVMATHSRTGIVGDLLGSVARRIVHNSTLPVLLMRPRAFSQAR